MLSCVQLELQKRRRTPSLDRVDNTQGYSLSNVFVICFRCNTVKGQADIEDIKNLLQYISENTKTSSPDRSSRATKSWA